MREYSIRPRAAIKVAGGIFITLVLLGGCGKTSFKTEFDYSLPARSGETVEVHISRHAVTNNMGCSAASVREAPFAMTVNGRPPTPAEYDYYLSLVYIPGEKDPTNTDQFRVDYTFDAVGDPNLGIRPKS
jgi:hypothetical protein